MSNVDALVPAAKQYAHRTLMSDVRRPISVLDLRDLTMLEGRILVHGEDESSGRNYLLLEGTDARVHYIYYTPAMEAARNRGGLKTNAFIRLRGVPTDGHPTVKIVKFGDAELMLRNKLHLRVFARRHGSWLNAVSFLRMTGGMAGSECVIIFLKCNCHQVSDTQYCRLPRFGYMRKRRTFARLRIQQGFPSPRLSWRIRAFPQGRPPRIIALRPKPAW